ncbi:hypothetical protein FRZ06_04510 [Anoxybacterium hadale]|uniref:Uncharacterized protein n=1 Tax=Anoxybacterium hadale TaxID=3408580 RepID=A0ACD1A8I6_9FIRM|nr:hypothetical protein FRZ06_04510 [Clostridiales bacterium]
MIHKNELNGADINTGEMDAIRQAGWVFRDLAGWMRAYMISSFEELSDLDAVRLRLTQMPMEFGNILRLYFGNEMADTYTTMFSDYIASVEAMIDAQKNGDDNAVNGYMEQIHHNLHHSSMILSQINPFWKESEWRALFFRYLLLTIDEANALLSGDDRKSAEIYETLLSVATQMANYFVNGLSQYIDSNMSPVQ